MERTQGHLVHLVHLIYLVHLAHLIYPVHLVHLVHPVHLGHPVQTPRTTSRERGRPGAHQGAA